MFLVQRTGKPGEGWLAIIKRKEEFAAAFAPAIPLLRMDEDE
jgi:hypothetical protein